MGMSKGSDLERLVVLHQQELIIPRDSSNESNPSNNLVIDVTYSYNTGSYQEHGNVNHLEIKITGYII